MTLLASSLELILLKINMLDGTSRTLANVRHVHDRRKKLISYKILYSNEYMLKVENDIVKACKEAQVMIKLSYIRNT